MRRSEVVGIQREHLDLMHGVVHLPHTKNGRAHAAARARATPLGHRPMRGRIFAMRPGSVTRAFIRATPRPPAL